MSTVVLRSAALLCALGLMACRKELAKVEVSKPVKTDSQVSIATTPHSHAHTNRLAQEKSPYLLQHQFNPVDWYAWGEEAFAKARQENKPIFVSIGYSTCHWCHVMERESFESEEVAKFLNQHFVSIKVDREERPDVDKIYMTFVQATTGQGGWPLNAFLTPELKPFFGGTYFPPDARYGRPSFLQMLQQIQQLWQTRRSELANSAAEIHSRLEQAGADQGLSAIVLSADVLRDAARQIKRSYDPRNGGFGDAPKFPQPSHPQFLLRYGKRFKDDEAIRMVLNTCDHMAGGGIHDHLGGGFARYSVDAHWLVPHFEKMLYDNAQLTQLYLDAFLISGEKRYADTARDILQYVLRDMTHREGGFYSAEDADSEGHEGKFYCWTKEELSRLLSSEEFKTAVTCFGITDKGNFVDHSHPQPLPNQNVLSIQDPKLENSELLVSAKRKMLAERSKRVRPHLDDKILVSWNGLMLGAIAQAYAVLGDTKYRDAAEKNIAFLQANLWEPAGKPGASSTSRVGILFHRWRDGQRDNVELLEGYAFLLSGTLGLYEATLEPRHLDFSIALAEAMIQKFYDPENGGFWQSTAEAKDLILRVKEDYDGAEPSGNSVAMMSLFKLAKITERKDFLEAAEKSLRSFASRMQQMPQAVPYMLQVLDFSLEEPRRAVVAGDPRSTQARELLHAVHSVYQPHKVVLGNSGPIEPFAKTLPAKNGAVLYLCTGTSCQPPTDQVDKVRSMLK
jgi:uncharacterized protein YyaL (SSP411 family)